MPSQPRGPRPILSRLASPQWWREPPPLASIVFSWAQSNVGKCPWTETLSKKQPSKKPKNPFFHKLFIWIILLQWINMCIFQILHRLYYQTQQDYKLNSEALKGPKAQIASVPGWNLYTNPSQDEPSHLRMWRVLELSRQPAALTESGRGDWN